MTREELGAALESLQADQSLRLSRRDYQVLFDPAGRGEEGAWIAAARFATKHGCVASALGAWLDGEAVFTKR